MSEQFQEITEDDFVATAPRPAGTNPDTGKPFTTREVMSEMLGEKNSRAAEIEPSAVKRTLAGAGLALTNKYRGLTGQPAADDFGLNDDTAGRFGTMLPDATVSMAVPAQIVPQALYGAATRAIEPGSPSERVGAAVRGATEFGGGQAVASGLVRGLNASTGQLTRPGQYANAARLNGLDLSAGDITDSNMLRLLEEKSFSSPSAGQMGQVSKLMADPTDNPIVHAVRTAYDAAQGRVKDAAKLMNDAIATHNLPGVIPRNTYSAIQDIFKHSPHTLQAIGDPALKEMLEQIATYPAGKIPRSTDFVKMDELRKVVGSIQAAVKKSYYADGKIGGKLLQGTDLMRWSKLFGAISDDLDNWAPSGAPKEVLDANKAMRDTFKNDVLPLREHPVAGKILDDGYSRSEDIVRDLTAARNRTAIDSLYDRLDQAGKNAFDAFRAAKRGTREFRTEGTHAMRWEKPLAITGAAALPFVPGGMAALPWAAAALAAEQGLVHGLNSRVGKAILSGSPQAARNPLANAALYSAARTGAQETGRAGLQALREELQ